MEALPANDLYGKISTIYGFARTTTLHGGKNVLDCFAFAEANDYLQFQKMHLPLMVMLCCVAAMMTSGIFAILYLGIS